MRDCVFLVADKNMAATFRGFFGRECFHLRLGIGAFAFDHREDLIVDHAGKDPGVYTRAHELLRPYLESHRRAVVALDSEWEGSPGPTKIVDRISQDLRANGWAEERFSVVVIEPELENWFWQDNPHVSYALRYRSEVGLKQFLEAEGLWGVDAAKPARPKEAVEYVLRQTRRPRSSAMYEEVSSRVSTNGCVDPAFQLLRQALQTWFPAETL